MTSSVHACGSKNLNCHQEWSVGELDKLSPYTHSLLVHEEETMAVSTS